MRLKKFNEFRNIINESVDSVRDEIADVKQELGDINRERKEVYNDMEVEAGQKGDDWTDEDGNRYGSMLNDLDEKEVELRKKLEDLQTKLSEEKRREYFDENIKDFRNLLEEVTDFSEFEIKYDDDAHFVTIEVQIEGKDELTFKITNYDDLLLNELNTDISLGDLTHDKEEIKKALQKIFSLEGEDYTNFIKSFDDEEGMFDEEERKDREEAEKNVEKEIHPIGDDEDLSDQEDVIADE